MIPQLRVLVVADLAPGRQAGPVAVEGGTAGVDAALAALAPALTVTVPNRLGTGGRDLAVALSFACLDDFSAGALARQVPAPPAAPAPPEAPAAGDPLAGLLSQVDLPAGDSPVALQAAEIANAEPVRDLEAAWRGVALLAGCAAAHPGVRLEVLAAGREDFLDAFYEAVFKAEHEGTSAVPLSAVVLGYELDRTPVDVEDLRHLARMGESLRVPVLAAVAPSFWGVRQAKLLANLPDLGRKVQGSEYAKWNGLRNEEASLWLCLAANRLVLRHGEGGGRPLVGSGAYGLAAALMEGFAADGVRFPAGELAPATPEVVLPDQKVTEIAGVGLVPLAVRRGDEARIFFPAVPTLHAPKRYDKAEATLSAARVSTLPYQAFAGAAAHALEGLGRQLGPGLAAEEVKQHFEAGLLAFLGTAAEEPADSPEVVIEVQPDAEGAPVWEVLARLTPRFQVAGGDVDLVLGSTVPR